MYKKIIKLININQFINYLFIFSYFIFTSFFFLLNQIIIDVLLDLFHFFRIHIDKYFLFLIDLGLRFF